jgi:membrane-associated protease RseP (regulator of RpoE activity)
MSGPKHLWSGDWQRESEAASSSRAHRAPRAPDTAPAAEPAPGPPRRRFRRPRASVTGVIVGVAVLVLAGVAFGLSSLLGSSSPRSRHTPPGPVASATVPTVPTTPAPLPRTAPPTQTVPPVQTQTAPQPNPPANTPTVNWLGMEIATQPPGAAVVQTVTIGTPADRAGINPGETIEAVNGRTVHSAQDVATVVKGLSRGVQVRLALAYGSGYSQAELTLGAPPSVVP